MPTRRQFLKTGLAGTALLAAGGGWYVVSRNEDETNALLRVVSRAVLSGVPTGDDAVANEKRMKTAIAGLSASAQAEIRQLLGLLTFPPTRLLLAGISQSWATASTADAARFLEDWRLSRLDLLKSGYAALHDLTIAAHYGTSESWSEIGYPGPPSVPRAPG